MSRLAHVKCEDCCAKHDEGSEGEVELSDSFAGRICCYCGEEVDWAMILHRHPDAIPCKGIHVRT